MRILPMSDECAELDKKIGQYRRIAFSVNDRLTLDRIKTVIAKLEAQKAALHPKQE